MIATVVGKAQERRTSVPRRRPLSPTNLCIPTVMSLYYDASELLQNPSNAGGSLRSRIYRQTGLRSSPAHLYALISETTKWAEVMREVVEKSDLLREEKKVSVWSSTIPPNYQQKLSGAHDNGYSRAWCLELCLSYHLQAVPDGALDSLPQRSLCSSPTTSSLQRLV